MKKIFLSILAILAIFLLLGCSKETQSPAQKDIKALESYTEITKVPFRESKNLISSEEAPLPLQKLASYSNNPTFFKVTKYQNTNTSGYYLQYTGEQVATSYLQANKIVATNFNCPNRTGMRMENAAIIDCQTKNETIKITITKLNESNSNVEVNWMIQNE